MASEKRKIAKAAGIVSALTLLSRILGLGRDVVISYLFGAGMAAEAFFVAFRFPNLFRRLVAEGAMSVAFVPVFAEIRERQTREQAAHSLRAVLGVAVGVLAVVALAGAVFAPLWIDLVAPGFANAPALRALTVELTRWLFPYLFFIGLVAILAGYLNASRHFLAPALSPAVLNVCVIGCAVALTPVVDPPVFALAIGVLLGGSIQLLLQVSALVRRGVVPIPRWDPSDAAARRIGRLLLPATAGTAIFQINILVGTMLASLLPLGSVSYLWYADRVFEFPLGLVVSALGTAALPSMASQAARHEYDELGGSIVFAVGLMTFLAIPSTAGLVILAEPIVAVLFERGEFGAAESLQTARALRCYAFGLWSVSLARLLAPAFYALGDPRTPVRLAYLTVAINVVASMALMGPVSAVGSPAWLSGLIDAVSLADLDHAGLALATGLAASVQAVALIWRLRGRLGSSFDLRAVAGSFLRSALATAPMVLAVYGVSEWWSPTGGWTERMLALAFAIGTGLAVFGGAAFLVGGAEVERARRLLRERLARAEG